MFRFQETGREEVHLDTLQVDVKKEITSLKVSSSAQSNPLSCHTQ